MHSISCFKAKYRKEMLKDLQVTEKLISALALLQVFQNLLLQRPK